MRWASAHLHDRLVFGFCFWFLVLWFWFWFIVFVFHVHCCILSEVLVSKNLTLSQFCDVLLKISYVRSGN
jgi:hypothetical protein